MSFEYTVDRERARVTIVGSGETSMEERLDCIGRLFADETIAIPSDVLINVTGITTAPTSEELQRIVLLVDMVQSRFNGRVAIVNGRAGHSLASALVAISSDPGTQRVRAFLGEEMANQWLSEAKADGDYATMVLWRRESPP